MRKTVYTIVIQRQWTNIPYLYLKIDFLQILPMGTGFEPLNLGSLVDCSTTCATGVSTKYQPITTLKEQLFLLLKQPFYCGYIDTAHQFCNSISFFGIFTCCNLDLNPSTKDHYLIVVSPALLQNQLNIVPSQFSNKFFFFLFHALATN